MDNLLRFCDNYIPAQCNFFDNTVKQHKIAAGDFNMGMPVAEETAGMFFRRWQANGTARPAPLPLVNIVYSFQ